MSLAVLAKRRGTDALPSYFTRTLGGERASGEDSEFIATKLIDLLRHGAEPERLVLNLHSSLALARFSKLASSLKQLLQAPENDEFGPARPSLVSITRATGVLFSLAQFGFDLPEALDVGTDHDGAVRVVWENGPRFLELIVPFNEAPYLYYSHGDQYDLQQDLSADALRRRFNWLRGFDQP